MIQGHPDRHTPRQPIGGPDRGGSMSEVTERYRRAAAAFTERVQAVPDDGWERPAPCEGWVARDVVRHLVEWVPGFFDAALQARLDDPATVSAEVSHPRAGTHRFDDAVGTFVLGDVLVHTWDLARAAGLDERLDPELVHDLLVGLEPMDGALRSSGQFGTRVEVAPDADEQTRLIAFTGRRP
jgi:hypothetical protein